MNQEEILVRANAIVAPYNLRAEIFGDPIGSVGVGGDERTYTPVINIIGFFPGYEILARISSEISNTLPINRVTFQVASKFKNAQNQ